MPIPITPKPQYPNVPAAPGVPPLLRKAGNIQNTAITILGDLGQVRNLFLGPQWGLFTQGGTSAFTAPGGGFLAQIVGLLGAGGNSVGGVEYRQENRIASAPQEEGAFLSYNKVSSPWNGKVTYLVGGLEANRSAFLNQCIILQGSLDLLSLVMPEITYPSCNVFHHDYRRTSHAGISLLAVDIWVEEVRVTGTAAFSNTASPSGATTQNGGTVQPQNASAVTGRLAGPT